MTLISCGIEISIAGGVAEMVCAYLLGPFLYFYIYHVLLVKVQGLTCSASYSVKKTLIPNNHLLHLFMGKVKHPASIGKVPLD